MNRADTGAPHPPSPRAGDSERTTTGHDDLVPEGPAPLTPRVVDVSSRPVGADVPSRPADAHPVANGDRPLPFTNAIDSVTRMGLGAVGMIVSTVTEATGRVTPTSQSPPTAAATSAASGGILRLLPGALLGAGFEAERRILNASAAVETRLIQASAVLSRRVPGAQRSALERSLVHWSERGRAEQARNELLMSEFVRRLAPELAEAIVARLPLEEIVSRVDMATLTRRLLESVDLAGIVRESTATVGSEVVDAGRTEAMGADAFVDRIVDRMLFRRQPRNLEVEGQ